MKYLYDHLKKRSGVASSECYFLQFSKIMKFQQMLLTDKNTKFTTKSVHIVTCGSFEICEMHMFTVCTHFVQHTKNVELTVFLDSVLRE